MVACGEQRSELRFELSQRDIWCSGSFLMSGAGREKDSDGHHVTWRSKRKRVAPIAAHAWMLAQNGDCKELNARTYDEAEWASLWFGPLLSIGEKSR